MYRRPRILSTLSFIAIIAYPIIGISDEDVWAKLKQGGYVVLMRHAKAEKIGDPLTLKINDCSVQRNLSAQGQGGIYYFACLFPISNPCFVVFNMLKTDQ